MIALVGREPRARADRAVATAAAASTPRTRSPPRPTPASSTRSRRSPGRACSTRSATTRRPPRATTPSASSSRCSITGDGLAHACSSSRSRGYREWRGREMSEISERYARLADAFAAKIAAVPARSVVGADTVRELDGARRRRVTWSRRRACSSGSSAVRVGDDPVGRRRSARGVERGARGGAGRSRRPGSRRGGVRRFDGNDDVRGRGRPLPDVRPRRPRLGSLPAPPVSTTASIPTTSRDREAQAEAFGDAMTKPAGVRARGRTAAGRRRSGPAARVPRPHLQRRSPRFSSRARAARAGSRVSSWSGSRRSSCGRR